MDSKNIETGKAIDSVKAHAGKYLTFVLGNEEYGFEILKVREIMGVVEITTLPQTPNYVKGIINLRSIVIPIIDLRLKFGFPPREYDKNTCIIVVRHGESLMGVVVDTVSEVLDISANDMDNAPTFGAGVNTDFILAMGKVKGKVKILLDIDKVLEAAAASLEAVGTAAA
jgi:purine-binding chemotaxis protein CheW